MDSKPDREFESGSAAGSEPAETQHRRELVCKLGKFAAYAAPFTVLALTSKAATSSGPGPHARK